MNCSSYAITEPSIDDEISGEKEASMASVLATYRETLVERTKHQLGIPHLHKFNMYTELRLFNLHTESLNV